MWHCDECVDRAFVEARDSLIRNTRLYERVDNYGEKVSSDERHTKVAGSDGKPLDEQMTGDKSSGEKTTNETTSDESTGLRLRPSSPVMGIAARLAQTISAAFSEEAMGGSNGVSAIKPSDTGVVEMQDEGNHLDTPEDVVMATEG
jgi:hypothetical protein